MGNVSQQVRSIDDDHCDICREQIFVCGRRYEHGDVSCCSRECLDEYLHSLDVEQDAVLVERGDLTILYPLYDPEPIRLEY